MVQVKKEDQEVKGRGGERLGKKRVFVICSSTGKKRIYMSVARNKKRKSILHEENMQDYIYVQYQKNQGVSYRLESIFCWGAWVALVVGFGGSM